VVQKEGAAERLREDVWKWSLSREERGVVDNFLAERASDVVTRVRFLELSGLVSNGRQGTIFVGYGLDVADGRRMRGANWEWNTVTGRPLAEGDADKVVMGKSLGAILGCETEAKEPYERTGGGYIAKDRPWKCAHAARFTVQATTEAAQANLVDVEPVGFLDAGLRELDNKYVVMPLELAWQLTDSDKVSRYTVEVAPGIDPRAFAADMKSYAAERSVRIDALPWKEHPFGELYRRTVSLMGVFRTFVLSIVVTIAMMAVFNSILKAVTERTREIGMMRSIGFRQREIVLLFSLEACFLSLLACAVGVVAAVGLSTGLTAMGIKYNIGIISQDIPLRIAVVPGEYLIAAAVLCAVSFLAGTLPALKAARMRISTALASN
jgi:putative ABC transport system permease protein